MYTATYVYANHDPEARLAVRAVESDKGDSWVLVSPGDEDANRLQLGMLPTQARDLAKKLFQAAGEAEAADAEVAARQGIPEAAP